MSKVINGWTLAAILGGVDDFVVSRSITNFDVLEDELSADIQTDSIGTSLTEYALGGVGGLFTYSLGVGLFNLGGKLGRLTYSKSSIVQRLVMGTKIGRLTLSHIAGWSAKGLFSSVVIGSMAGGVIGEYRLMKDWANNVSEAIGKLKTIYSKGIAYSDNETIYINHFHEEVTGVSKNNSSINVFGNIDDAENSQVNFILKTDLAFLEEVVPADNEKGILPVFNMSPNKKLSFVTEQRSNLSNVYSTLFFSKLAFNEPEKLGKMSVWDKFVKGAISVADKVNFGFSSARRRALINSVDSLQKLLKDLPPVDGGKISVQSINLKNPIIYSEGYSCKANSKYNDQVIDCEFYNNFDEGVYLLDYRQMYGAPSYLSIGALADRESSGGFEGFFEKAKCGLVTNMPANPKTNKLFCSHALGELYDLDNDVFTDKGMDEVDIYLSFVEKYYEYLTREPTLGFNFINDIFPEEDLRFIKKLVDAKGNYNELKKYKYFLTTAILGVPIFVVVGKGDPNTIFENFLEGEFAISYEGEKKADTKTDDKDVLSGQSLAYYLKVSNKKIIGDLGPSVSELKGDIDGKTGSDSGKKSNGTAEVSGGASITWNNILPTRKSTIIFPSVDGKQLKLVFEKSSWNGINYLSVYENDSKVDCYFNVWEGIWNALGGKNTLVYGLTDKKEVCDYAVNGKFIVDAELDKSGSYYSFNITSPLIPTNCQGKTFSQINDSLTVTC